MNVSSLHWTTENVLICAPSYTLTQHICVRLELCVSLLDMQGTLTELLEQFLYRAARMVIVNTQEIEGTISVLKHMLKGALTQLWLIADQLTH